jgi:hypothetical protein
VRPVTWLLTNGMVLNITIQPGCMVISGNRRLTVLLKEVVQRFGH